MSCICTMEYDWLLYFMMIFGAKMATVKQLTLLVQYKNKYQRAKYDIFHFRAVQWKIGDELIVGRVNLEHFKLLNECVRVIVITHRLCFMQPDTPLLLSLWIMTRIYFKKRACEDRRVSCSALGFSLAERKKTVNTFCCLEARGARECARDDRQGFVQNLRLKMQWVSNNISLYSQSSMQRLAVIFCRSPRMNVSGRYSSEGDVKQFYVSQFFCTYFVYYCGKS